MTKKVAKIIIRPLLALLLIFLSAPQRALSEGSKPISIELSASQLTPMATALDRFRSDGNKISDYRVLLISRTDGTEVVFVPELVKSSNMIGFERSTKPEVHYYVDVAGLKITKALFGK